MQELAPKLASMAKPAPKSAPRAAILVTLALLLASAAYLYAVRGSALLLDLAALAGMICF